MATDWLDFKLLLAKCQTGLATHCADTSGQQGDLCGGKSSIPAPKSSLAAVVFCRADVIPFNPNTIFSETQKVDLKLSDQEDLFLSYSFSVVVLSDFAFLSFTFPRPQCLIPRLMTSPVPACSLWGMRFMLRIYTTPPEGCHRIYTLMANYQPAFSVCRIRCFKIITK